MEAFRIPPQPPHFGQFVGMIPNLLVENHSLTLMHKFLDIYENLHKMGKKDVPLSQLDLYKEFLVYAESDV